MDTVKIGKFLMNLRKEKNLTQEQLGEQIGVTNKTISRWENGNYLPPIEMIQILSDFYGLSINEVLCGERLSEQTYKVKAENNIKLIFNESENTVAQAFHWFDVDKFKIESNRILKCGGKAILVWNTRDAECELCVENYRIFKKYCPRFNGFSGGIQNNDERIIKYFDGKYKTVDFDNPIIFNKDTFIERSLSSSYSLQKGDIQYSDYVEELNELFEKYSENGYLIMPNKSVAYIGIV